uniref:Uncharacterized protein n=1 Tax=Picea sitchensis TaxID=3332 RepID=B8LPA8_PICSI|nr:unknown [Picea sitchensis]
MMDGHNGKKKLHFLVFPWLAQGHIIPFLELSKALAIHGHKVSFLSTPVNISRFEPRTGGWSSRAGYRRYGSSRIRLSVGF